MKRANTHSRNHVPVLLTTAIVLVAVVALAVHGSVRSANTISITVHNGTQRSIQRLYLAPGDPDNWGPDQLNGSAISAGSSYTLSGLSCDGASNRVIAEDQNGCFSYFTVSCSQNATWAITSDTPVDCGS